MELINLVIDNTPVSVAAGTSVLAAARLAGIYIPALCSHPDLPPAVLEMPTASIFQAGKKVQNTQPNKTPTKCGMCIVEIKGEKNLLSSCTSQVQKGMVVITNSEKIREQRKENLIPILSRHRHACLTCAQQEGCSQTQCSSNVPEDERCCSKFGNCELRNLASFVGISDNTPKWIPTTIPIIETNPLFKIDYNLCIACTRCVRVCTKVRGVGAIGFAWNNENILQVGSIQPGLIDSECKFCTACVEVCPTGALEDKTFVASEKEAYLVPCRNTCPAHVNIPEYLRMIALNKFDEANAIIREKIPFPGILGRICIHPCETVCRRKEIDNAVSICALKRFVSDTNYDHYSWTNSLLNNHETGKKVIIIGAGPTGLTASFYLRKKGHAVTIYDEKPKPGGMLRYGIPEYRLPSQILDHEIEAILAMGIEFKPNKKLGIDFGLASLQDKKSDAILIAVGAQTDRKINIEGCDLNGVLGGITFLRSVSENNNVEVARKVIVIGGGNVAIDVAMTAIRLGAKEISIVCLETEDEMPANTWEIQTAKFEGVKILSSWLPKKILGKNGHVVGLDLAKCTCVFDVHGNFNPQCDNETRKKIIADQVLIAIGQETDLTFLNSTTISTNNGLIVTDRDTLETTVPGIYAGGDATSMPGSVVEAIASGIKAAESIDAILRGTEKNDEALPPYSEKYASAKEYLGKESGFTSRPREQQNEISVTERSGNFGEIVLGLSKDQAIREASRCLQCDLRLNLNCNPSPSKKILLLTDTNLNTAIPSETEGIYRLFDKDKNIIALAGTGTLRHDLMEALKNKKAIFFEFEEDKMYSKRESELLQKHLQEHGEMPGGDEDMDDLF